MGVSPTFPCPTCGAPISGPPGEVFACPFCHSNVVAPGLPDPTAPHGLFTSGIHSLSLACDPQIGVVLAGPHLPAKGKPCIRAYDLYNQRVGWESLVGSDWISDDTTTTVLGSSVYVLDRRRLVALDLKTGTQKWTASLPAAAGWLPAELRQSVYDFAPPEGPGVVFVATVDRSLAAFERVTGAPLWTRRYEPLDEYWGEATPLVRRIEQSGGGVAHDRRVAEIIAPTGATVVTIRGATPDAMLYRCDVHGHHAILQVASWATRGDSGMVVCDISDPRPQFFAMPRPFLKCNSAWMGDRAYVVTDIGAMLRTRGNVAVPPPVVGCQYMALVPAGGVLLALLWNSDVAPYVRRLAWLDPSTLAERFEGTDLGSVGGDSGDGWARHVVTDGRIVIAVASPEDDVERCELRAFDAATSRPLWKRPIGEWRRHGFSGGYVVVRTTSGFSVLRPNDGEPITTYAAPDA
jgi:hypothetical protein